MKRVVIVGASAGGLSTAEALRRLGHDGPITLVGEEQDLPYDRPPLSKQMLRGEWSVKDLDLRTPESLAVLNCDWRLGVRASGLDPGNRLVELGDGSELGYDEVVVATGSRPRCLPGTEHLRGVHVLRSIRDAVALRDDLRPGRRLVIIGAGFIGSEVAATARALGVEVTLLEAAPVPLARAVGTSVGSMLMELHRENGVVVKTSAFVSELLSVNGTVTGVVLQDGTVVVADLVLVAIGSLPNTEWLAGGDLDTVDGLRCDQYCAAAEGVWGVGDVARWYNPLFETSMRVEHRTNAAEQAIAVARNLLSRTERHPFAPVPYFWSDQYSLRIQAYGLLTGHEEAVVVDGDLTSRSAVVAYRRGQRLVGVLAVGASPRVLRGWRARLAVRTNWQDLPQPSIL